MLAVISAFHVSPAFGDEYAFILKGRGNLFWKGVYEGVSEAAAELGVKASLYNTDSDQAPEEQLNICLAAIQRRPKVLVMGAATKSVGLECYRKALAAGIPVADIDGNVTAADAKEAGLNLSFTVGSDNYRIGELAADYLKESSPDNNPKVLIIEGLVGSIVSEKRVRGFRSRLEELLPGATVVGSYAASWDRMKALNITIDALKRTPDISYIFSASDIMTMGVIEAVRMSKLSPQVISVDATRDGVKAVKSGRIAANVAQLPYMMGRRAVELAKKLQSESFTEHTEYTPTPVLTRKVLEEGTEPNLRYLR